MMLILSFLFLVFGLITYYLNKPKRYIYGLLSIAHIFSSIYYLFFDENHIVGMIVIFLSLALISAIMSIACFIKKI